MTSILRFAYVGVALNLSLAFTCRADATQSKLDLPLREVKFDQVSLGDSIDFLSDVSDARITVNWKALEAVGVKKTAMVNVNLRNVKLSKALHVILDEAAGAKDKVGFEIEKGVITISILVDFIRAKTYDVGFLFPETMNEGERKKLAEGLVKLVKETIDEESWGKDGRSCTVDPKKGEMRVVQEIENQHAVENLIAQLRESRTSAKAATQKAGTPAP